VSVFTAALVGLLFLQILYNMVIWKNRFLSIIFREKNQFKSRCLATLKYNAKEAIDREFLQMQILRFAGKSLYFDLNLKDSRLSR